MESSGDVLAEIKKVQEETLAKRNEQSEYPNDNLVEAKQQIIVTNHSLSSCEAAKTFLFSQSVKKPIILVLIRSMSVSADFLKSYLFSRLGIKTLAASMFISAAARFTIDPVAALTEQNAIFLANEYGRLQLLSAQGEADGSNVSNIKEAEQNIGSILRQGWVFAILSSLPSVGILLAIKPILQLIGQSAEVSEIVQAYYLPVAFAVPLEILESVNERFFTAIDKEQWLIPFKFAFLSTKIILSLTLIPAFDVRGAGLAVLINSLLSFSITTLFMWRKSDFNKYSIFAFFEQSSNRPSCMLLTLKQGWPLALGQLTLTGTNFVVTGFVGHLGELRLAIEQAALQYMSLPTTIIKGITEATQRLVSQAFGAKDYTQVRIYGMRGVFVAGAMFSVVATGICLGSNKLASTFLETNVIEENETLIRASFILLALNKLFNIIQDGFSLNLSGMTDTLAPFLINLLTTLAIVLPLSALSVYVMNFDIYGVTGAMDIGLLVAAGGTFTYWSRQTNFAIRNNDFDTAKDTSNAKLAALLGMFKKNNSINYEVIDSDKEVENFSEDNNMSDSLSIEVKSSLIMN